MHLGLAEGINGKYCLYRGEETPRWNRDMSVGYISWKVHTEAVLTVAGSVCPHVECSKVRLIPVTYRRLGLNIAL
jgi:hypothetical protein